MNRRICLIGAEACGDKHGSIRPATARCSFGFTRQVHRREFFCFVKAANQFSLKVDWLEANVIVAVSRGEYGLVYTIKDGDRLQIVCGAAFLAETSDYNVALRHQLDENAT